MRLVTTLLVIGVIAGLGGCGGEGTTIMPVSGRVPITTKEEATGLGKWTVLVYLDADNDLETYGISNMNQMESVGSSKDVRIVVQVDRSPGHDSSNGNWTDTRRYLVTQDNDPENIRSIRLDEDAPLGELDMGDWRTLKDFVDWGARTFPAEHFCVVMWNHGTGWEFFAPSKLGTFRPRYISSDDTSDSAMEVTEIAKALGSLKPDVLAFDACLMQQMEIAYQLKDCALYMVGASSPEPSPGYNYSRWLAAMSSSTTSADLCSTLVREFVAEYPEDYGITQSAVDMSKIPAAAEALGRFASVLNDEQAGKDDMLAVARQTSLNYSTSTSTINRHTVDILDYAGKCNSIIGLSAEFAYSALCDAVKAAVIAEAHGRDMSGSCGLSIYCPPPDRYQAAYRNLDFALFTDWDEWLQAQTK